MNEQDFYSSIYRHFPFNIAVTHDMVAKIKETINRPNTETLFDTKTTYLYWMNQFLMLLRDTGYKHHKNEMTHNIRLFQFFDSVSSNNDTIHCFDILNEATNIHQKKYVNNLGYMRLCACFLLFIVNTLDEEEYPIESQSDWFDVDFNIILLSDALSAYEKYGEGQNYVKQFNSYGFNQVFIQNPIF